MDMTKYYNSGIYKWTIKQSIIIGFLNAKSSLITVISINSSDNSSKWSTIEPGDKLGVYKEDNLASYSLHSVDMGI